MKIAEIYEILDSLAPFETQEAWDNSGLLVGDMSDSFDQIYVSLDLDSNLVDSLEENSLIITHHPLIFKGLKKFNGGTYPSNLIKKLIQKEIKLICMHTNFDKHILNDYVAKEILNYEVISKDEFIVKMRVDMSFDELCKDIKAKFGLKNLRVVKASDRVKTVALCTGSGADLIGTFEADCFITGDLKYHAALESLENNLSLIDINHYESEVYFGQSLAKNLQKNKIEVIITHSINPFRYI